MPRGGGPGAGTAAHRPESTHFDTAAIGDLHEVLVAHQLAGVRRHQRGCGFSGPSPPLDGGQVAGFEHAGHPEPEERLRLLDRRSQRRRVALREVARVDPRGKRSDPHVDLVALLPLVELVRGGLTGCVGIETQHDPRREPLEDLDVFFGERRPAGRHGTRHAGLGVAHDVGVALTDDHLVGAHDMLLGPVEAVEEPGLGVDG